MDLLKCKFVVLKEDYLECYFYFINVCRKIIVVFWLVYNFYEIFMLKMILRYWRSFWYLMVEKWEWYVMNCKVEEGNESNLESWYNWMGIVGIWEKGN